MLNSPPESEEDPGSIVRVRPEGVTDMGRGRQKAKPTRVARELKYRVPKTDYAALERELTGNARLEDDLDKWPEYQGPEDEDADGAPSGPEHPADK